MPGFGTLRRVTVGQLRHRVKIEENTSTTVDDRGHVASVWSTVAYTRCAIRQLTATEIENVRQLSPEATHRVFMRFNSALDEKMRLIFGDRTFYIGAFDNVEQDRRYMTLLVSEDKRS